MSERIDTITTNCDGCGTVTRCAVLGPNGHYTLALCADCHKPLRQQDKEDALLQEMEATVSRMEATLTLHTQLARAESFLATHPRVRPTSRRN
jgi:hypothetical protein